MTKAELFKNKPTMTSIHAYVDIFSSESNNRANVSHLSTVFSAIMNNPNVINFILHFHYTGNNTFFIIKSYVNGIVQTRELLYQILL